VAVALVRGAAIAAEINGDAKDAQGSAGRGSLPEPGVDVAGGVGADRDLITQTCGNDERRDTGQRLDLLGGVRSELVGRDVNVP